MNYTTIEELKAGFDAIRRSPTEEGVLALIVRRPNSGQREILEEGELDLAEGLVGTTGKPGAAPRPRTAHRIPICN